MRLLNATSRQLEEFVGEDEIPPYAILSHTWGKPADEVKLQDLNDRSVKKKIGYRKIAYCCEQALEDGLEWVWVDTCCIDKTSTAELSEAINSMYQWYQNAKICYAYLADVADALERTSGKLTFVNSHWFTRGWTLQELLAPRELVFYSRNWKQLGTKHGLATSSTLLSTATKIESEYLRLRDQTWLVNPSSRPSIAKIMSWAADRKTTRVEDMAYCLLGLFDINMPLLYGEGKRAFFRLQEELLKSSNDQSLFAWGLKPDTPLQNIDLSMSWLSMNLDVDETWGMFARSPEEFRHSGNICRRDLPEEANPIYRTPASVVNRGVLIELPIFNRAAVQHLNEHHNSSVVYSGPQLARIAEQSRMAVFAVLACSIEGDEHNYLAIPLFPCVESKVSSDKHVTVATGQFGCHRPMVLVPQDTSLSCPAGTTRDLRNSFALIHIESYWWKDWNRTSRLGS